MPSGVESQSDTSGESGIARTWLIVELLTERAPAMFGVSAIARELDMSKAVAHRIVKELVRVGFLHFDDDLKQYGLGGGALAIGLAAMRSVDVVQIARPYLAKLSASTGETATLSIREGHERTYADQALPAKEVRMQVTLGGRYPLHAGSSSKAILAAMSDSEIDEYLRSNPLEALTETTITDPDTLRRELDLIRERGVAESHGERQSDAGSVAAAIRGLRGDVVGGISVCGPKQRVTPDFIRRATPDLKAAAAHISIELGYVPPF